MDVVEIFESFAGNLKGFARGLCRDDTLADDLVQDVFVKAMTNAGLLAGLPEKGVKAWLYTTLRNRFIDIVRKRRFETTAEDWDDLPSRQDFEAGVDQAQLIATLPAPVANIIYRKFWLNMNATEIAQELAMPPGTVRYHLHQGIRELRRKLGIDLGHP
jgi:RNA polymerase sigma-70 factor, ECF subfamily